MAQNLHQLDPQVLNQLVLNNFQVHVSYQSAACALMQRLGKVRCQGLGLQCD